MSAKKAGIISLICLLIAFFSGYIAITWIVSTYTLPIVSITTGIVGICFLVVFIATLIANRRVRSVSVPLILGIADVIIALLFVAYAIYDMNTNTYRMFSGLAGMLILVYVIPINAIILLVDIGYVIWRKKKKQKSDEKEKM